MGFILKLNQRLADGLLVLGGIVLVMMMCLACANMVLRGVSAPIKGTYELMGFMGALVTAFGLAATQNRKGHIALTIMAGMFPRRVERFIDAASFLCCGLFFLLIARQTSLWALSLVKTGELSETLRIIYYPFPLIAAFGVAALGLSLVCDFIVAVFGDPGKKSARGER